MAPLYISRVETVLCLRQMAEDQGVDSASVVAAQLAVLSVACNAAPLPPDAPVQRIAGAPVTKYAFAVRTSSASTPSQRQSLDATATPIADDGSSSSSTAGPAALWGDSSDGEDATSGVPPATPLAHGSAEDDGLGSFTFGAPQPDEEKSLLDSLLLAQWEECAEQGLFRYDVTACPTRLIPGLYGFVAQLNEGRASQKRATEVRIDQVCQPFDEAKFNFKKAFMREVLFQFEPHAPAIGTAAGAARHACSSVEEASPASLSPTVVLINVSPIEYGHVLLCPRVLDGLPQLVCRSTALLALRFAMESDNPYFRVGYNSLGAYATINHLHFQAYYLATPFPCERAPCCLLAGGLKRKRGGVRVSRLVNYPVNGFVLEVGDSVEELAAVLAHACQVMQQRDVPHNLLITDAGTRVFLWPQCYAEKQAQGRVPEALLATGVNPAVFEVAGHLVLKRREDYHTMTQEFAWSMLAEVSLAEEAFTQLAAACF